MPVTVHKKMPAHVGTRRKRATTVAHTRTLVIQTTGSSGVDRARSRLPVRGAPSLSLCLAIRVFTRPCVKRDCVVG